MQKPVLGLDFGTTNTSAAWCDDKGEVHLVPVREGVYTLPSVACFHGRGTLVGEPARQLAADDPRHTIFGVKRFLGRRYFSDYVGRHRSRFVFHLTEGKEGMTAVEVHGKVVPLEDVALAIIERMVELANIALGEPFEEAVCCVPAHFSQRQRRIIASVIKRAGLRLKAMVNEPTAAAIYYAKHQAEDTKVLVYDLGGGTFDTTLLRVRKGLVEVLSTGGEAFLGGSDFDARLADHLAERFEIDHGVKLQENGVVMQRLQIAAEAAKIQLSSENTARVRASCVHVENDRFLDLDYELPRGEMEQVVAPLVERTLGIALQTVGGAGMSTADVDEVLLIGGQTRMPGLRRRLETLFRIDHSRKLDPELGVAVGAATLGRGLQVLVDVLSIPIGVMLPGAGPQEAIAKNTPLPCVKRVTVARPPPGRPLPMVVYEALEATSIDRDVLGTLKVSPDWLARHEGDLQLELRMSSSFELTFQLRASDGGELPLRFSDVESGKGAGASESGTGNVSREEAPRVTCALPITVRFAGEHDVHVLRTGNLSPQGMFIESNDPPPSNTAVELVLDVEGEPLALRGVVMHSLNAVNASSIGQPPGFGVRLTDVSPAALTRLNAFCEKLSRGTGTFDLDPAALAAVDPQQVTPLDVLKRFMDGIGKSDYYAALALHPLASSAEVKERVAEMHAFIDGLVPKVSAGVQVKLKTAARILERVAAVLYDPRKRLVYDFQKGLVLAEERLGRPGESGIFDIGLLREAWRRVHPAESDKAAVHLAYAARAEARGDIEGALNAGREALRLDPFDLALRMRLADWDARMRGLV